jgi:diguanylate cyclase (GGDEF)-like protein
MQVLSNLGLTAKLNLLAISIILFVGLTLSAAAVLTIDRLTAQLGERQMTTEVGAMFDKLLETKGILRDSGVSDVPAYINAAQADFLRKLNPLESQNGGKLYVLNGQGRVLFNQAGRSQLDFSEDVTALILAERAPVLTAVVAGQDSKLAIGRFEPWDWRLVLVMSDAQINAQRNQFLNYVLLILIASVLAGGLLFAWLAAHFVRPIHDLSKTMGSLTEDNLDQRLDIVSTSREVDALQNAFQSMVRRLYAANVKTKAAEEFAWHQAHIDSLTQLPNRRLFQQRLDEAIQSSDLNGRPMALLFLDLDRFKDVNDSLGHDQGDLLLIEAGSRIGQCIRQTDTLARLGGDEFIVILSDVTDEQLIERTAQAVVDELSRPFTLATTLAYVSASIGITQYPVHASNSEALLRSADQAMYVAKREGKSCFRHYNSSLLDKATLRVNLVNDLRLAIDQHQFVLYYQPIIDLKDKQIRKAEALIRWKHPLRGWVSPAEFIPVAEETGLIHKLGDWVFKEAVRQLKVWKKIIDPEFMVSFNLSPIQLAGEHSLVDQWELVLDECSLPRGSLIAEITEGVYVQSEREVLQRLQCLRRAGVELALDDFGTGYSSLSYLRRFTTEFLKIDKSFIDTLEHSPEDRACCEAIIVMAHKLGIKVIAEGVETGFQAEFLEAAGADAYQGYYKSPPINPQALAELVHEARKAHMSEEV